MPINAKKNNLTKKDLIDYFGSKRLGLSLSALSEVKDSIEKSVPSWKALIGKSFFLKKQKDRYVELLEERLERIF